MLPLRRFCILLGVFFFFLSDRICFLFFFFLIIRRPPRSPLFPSPTLFRSCAAPATPLYAPLPSSAPQASQVTTTAFLFWGSLLRSSTPPPPRPPHHQGSGPLADRNHTAEPQAAPRVTPTPVLRCLGRATATAEG